MWPQMTAGMEAKIGSRTNERIPKIKLAVAKPEDGAFSGGGIVCTLGKAGGIPSGGGVGEETVIPGNAESGTQSVRPSAHARSPGRNPPDASRD